MLKENISKVLVGLAVVAGMGASFVGIVNAQSASTGSTTTTTSTSAHKDGRGPGVMGTVSAISGDTLTVTDKRSGTAYTVDATNAKIMVGGTAGAKPTTGTIASIKVGDTVGVRGTVSGTSVTATDVMDGVMGPGGPGRGGPGHGVQGTISAVNGDTITITNSDGTTYTVDATSATVSKMEDLSVSDLKVGDTIDAQGTVSGTAVTATHIMDGVPAKP